MEYKTIVDKLNNLTDDKRKNYNELHALHQISINGGWISKSDASAGLENVLGSMTEGITPKVRIATRGFWIWKTEVYELSTYGQAVLRTEKENIQRIQQDISRISAKDNLDGRVDEVISMYKATPEDYFVKKMILNDRELDNYEAGIFTKTKSVGDYLDKRLEGKKDDLTRTISKSINRSPSAYGTNDSSDILTYAMLGGLIMNQNTYQPSYGYDNGRKIGDSSSGGCGGGTPIISACGGGSADTSSSTSGCGGGSSDSGSSGCGGGGGGCGGGGCGG